MEIKACIFDLDGTIIDSGEMIFESVRYALSPWGVELTSEDIEIIRARIPEDLFSGYLPTKEDEMKALKRLTEFSAKISDQVIVYDGMPELLKWLSDKVHVAVWTGRDTESARRILERNNLAHFFKDVVGCTHLNNNKPHPEGVGRICTKLKVAPSEVIIIGDHAHDVEGAKRFGAKSIHVTWSHHLVPLTQDDPKPDVTISTVQDLFNWLKNSIQ